MPVATESNLRTIPLDDIKVAEDFNPRKQFDTPEDADLAANVKQHGILLPLLVTADESDGKFWLVDGERRLRAAKKARLADAPVHVRPHDAPVATFALIANIQRRDLNPIEEANAIVKLLDAGTTQKDLARTLNVAPSHISERKKLLALPPLAMEAISTGKLPVASARFLLGLAKVSPAAADQAAVVLQSASMETDRTHPERAAQRIFDVIAENVHNDFGDEIPKVTAAFNANSMFNPEREPQAFVWPEGSDEIRASWDALPEHTWLRLSSDDIDAARAHGSLYELDRDDGRDVAVILDAEFLVDRIALAIANKNKEIEERASDRKRPNAAAASSGGEANTDSEPGEPEASEHQLREQARSAAHIRNTEIGRNSFKNLAEVKPTLANIRALVLAVLNKNTEMPGAGLALTDERLQTVETTKLKNGGTKTKITFATRAEAEDKLIARISSAKTIEELLGVFWSAVVAGVEADPEATLVSDRRYWQKSPFASVYNQDYRAVQDEAEKLALKVLPKAEADKRRAAEKAKRAQAKPAQKSKATTTAK